MNRPTDRPTDQPTSQPTDQPTNLPPFHSSILPLFPLTARIAADGHLHLAGLDAVALAAEFGTPLYVYDEATLRDRCRAYRDALAAHYPAPAEVVYAAKAFLCTALAQLLAQEGLGLDVVSGGELHIALRADFPAARIHLHGNNKSPAELAFALDAGAGRIVVDNFYELETLARLAAERSLVAPIWLRLSPGVDAHTHAYRQTGRLDSKFGLTIAAGDAARAVRQALDSPHLAPTGLHAHIGSQIFETAPFVQTVEALLDLAAEMQPHDFTLRELSVGGGLAARYIETDPPAPVEPYVQAISQAVVHGCRARGLPLPRLALEPGRSIVAQAGVALYTVGARKDIPSVRVYLSVDSGLADNPRPALYGAPYAALLANKADQPPTETVTVAGKFCESGDVLIRDVRLPRAAPGDLLAVPVSGAYHLAMSSNYNQTPRPAAILARDGQAQLILRRETHDDLARRDLPLCQFAARNSQFVIVGLGEALWDLLPSGKQPGGAPANFACHAAALGDRGVVASRVGLDSLGDELCTRLAALNLTTRHIQRDPARPTGVVHVQLDAAGQPAFTIAKDAAWDALAWTPEWAALAAEADAVCFGSLAQRSAASHQTVQRFLRAARPEAIRLFDVNLRQSYYSAGVLDVSLRRATIIKLNDAELSRVIQLLGLAVEGDDQEDDETLARRLLRAYELQLVCLTRGARGSLLVTEAEAVAHPGYSVQVVDTVGAGDSFAAAVAHHWLRGAPLAAIGEAANRLGAYVAAQRGATPPLPPDVRRRVLSPAAT